MNGEPHARQDWPAAQKSCTETLSQTVVQVGHFQVCALFIPVLTRAESPVSPTAQQQVRVQGLTGLCSQGLEHLLCVCLDLWPSFKLPSKETHCALYIKHSCCTTQIPITGQVTNHVYCMFGLLRAHSCTFLQKTALDQWEPSLPEKPGGLQTMTGTAIQNLVTLLQDTTTLWSYSCFRAFRGIRLRLDVSWNHIFASFPTLFLPSSLHYKFLLSIFPQWITYTKFPFPALVGSWSKIPLYVRQDACNRRKDTLAPAEASSGWHFP